MWLDDDVKANTPSDPYLFEGFEHKFPEAFAAYWVRVVADHDSAATAQFVYE